MTLQLLVGIPDSGIKIQGNVIIMITPMTIGVAKRIEIISKDIMGVSLAPRAKGAMNMRSHLLKLNVKVKGGFSE